MQIFVSIDENTTIKDLAAVLRIDLQLVKVKGILAISNE